MKTATTNESAAKHLTHRIVAIRAELREVRGDKRALARVQERALMKDLLGLEVRLAEVL